MSPLDLLTRIEPNRIGLKYCSFRPGKRVIVQRQHYAVVYMFGANLGKLQRTQIPSKHGDLRGP